MIQRQSKKTLSTNARHPITIQRFTSASDGEGGFTRSWTSTDESPVWASVEPIRAVQRKEYASINAEVTHIIRMTGYLDVSEDDRISFDGRIFEILTIENLQERDFCQVLICKEDRG